MVVETYMKVLLAGANSYIGTRLIPVLNKKGHDVVCLVRDKSHFIKTNPYADVAKVLSGDLLRRQSIEELPGDIDVACYFVNTFSQTSEFAALGALSAQNFMEVIGQTNCRQVITLSDINDNTSYNKKARLTVENILGNGRPALTVLNAAMIIGPGSTALGMFNTLASKTSIVVPQNWIKTRLQPIATLDVLQYLDACLLNESTFNKKFDVGGPDVLSFKQMLLIYIAVYKNIKPGIVILPFLTSQLSSHLLNTLAPVNYAEAQSLIENLKHDTVCRENSIKNVIPIRPLTPKQMIRLSHESADSENFQNIPLLKSN